MQGGRAVAKAIRFECNCWLCYCPLLVIREQRHLGLMKKTKRWQLFEARWSSGWRWSWDHLAGDCWLAMEWWGLVFAANCIWRGRIGLRIKGGYWVGGLSVLDPERSDPDLEKAFRPLRKMRKLDLGFGNLHQRRTSTQWGLEPAKWPRRGSATSLEDLAVVTRSTEYRASIPMLLSLIFFLLIFSLFFN